MRVQDDPAALGRGLEGEGGGGGLTFTATLFQSSSLGNAGPSCQRQPACKIPVIIQTQWVIERITSCWLNFKVSPHRDCKSLWC